MAAFSRLQLAAALLEYDNDPMDPDAPKRSAHDSAIFAHLRRTNGRRKVDYLGVSIPSESGSLGQESALDGRRSRSSIGALRNPFGTDETTDDHDDDEEEGLEVDLASWGLDSFIPKEKRSNSSRKKAKLETLPNPHPVQSLRRRPDTVEQITHHRGPGVRSMSLGYNNSFGAGGAFLDAKSSSGVANSPLDLAVTHAPEHQRPSSFHGLMEQPPVAPRLPSIPFPTISPRSDSPPPSENDTQPLRRYSDLDPKLRPHEAINFSFGGRLLDEEERNPFSIKPPSAGNASRFDPKANHARMISNASMRMSEEIARPLSRASKFDLAAARARTVSNGSMGSRFPLDNDVGSVMTGQGPYTQERPYSTLELMRPKVLVMPSPLQPVAQSSSSPPATGRDGFELSADGPPLPPGARTARRGSVAIEPMPPLSAPIASNSFTPNPRISLTLSQLTFRNTLMVGGERDVAYNDLDRSLPRATEDGEQIRSESPVVKLPEPAPVVQEPVKSSRPAGKLFGKSLIDDLENRKAQLRNKQRVFTGDERPSMMSRAHRSSTLIDPASLHARPISQHVNSLPPQGSQQPLGRKNSLNIKPLLNFDSDQQNPTVNLAADSTRNVRSVFGVDTIWEREMAKLQEIEAEEKAQADVIQKREEASQSKRRKGRRKGKGKSKEDDPELMQYVPSTEPHNDPSRVSMDPPVLPSIQKATTRRRPPVVDDDESDESAESADHPRLHGDRNRRDAEAELWVAGSSDEEQNGPRRTTGTGPRYPNVSRGEDSDEDLPLSVTVDRAMQRTTRRIYPSDGSDEEKPLSFLIQKAKLSLPSDNSPPPKREETSDDDDEPLALRASKVLSPSQVSGSQRHQDPDDDDKPLAFHPEQQRRTQYQMLAQHQQMMMQAQLHNSMFFGPPPGMMGGGFFPQPMVAPMMMPPPPIPLPSPPPLQDAAKFGRVDRWRRDVVVEGKP